MIRNILLHVHKSCHSLCIVSYDQLHVELKQTFEAWQNLLKLNLQLDRNGQALCGVINFCQMNQLLSQNVGKDPPPGGFTTNRRD
ncbi:hypothetical protein T10_13198 [Trichinella papuae]|uniref:Uncharacterized protein n=1 Tax=Trichinella papuae TaxID=268474 RepID=A0A0V1N560_9BILA|nr:hypothetical protein T10_13198 [Trichinella papuae]